MASQLASHGRGGAGNMADTTQSPKLKPSDLETPLLKTAVVTTGRGGTGNMAKNKDPHETRLRQDVKAVPRRFSSGAQHAGRGGAGNVFVTNEEEPELTRLHSCEQAIDDSTERTERTDKADKNDKTDATKKKTWLFGKKA